MPKYRVAQSRLALVVSSPVRDDENNSAKRGRHEQRSPRNSSVLSGALCCSSHPHTRRRVSSFSSPTVPFATTVRLRRQNLSITPQATQR